MIKPTVYLKSTDRSGQLLQAYLEHAGVDAVIIDIDANPGAYAQMVKRCGQTLLPCVLIDKAILAQPSLEMLETHLAKYHLRGPRAQNYTVEDLVRAAQLKARTQRKDTLKFF